VKQLYDQYLGIHEDQQAQKMKAQQAAKDGFIPTGGSLITVQMSLPDPQVFEWRKTSSSSLRGDHVFD
jgi:hypothetical protein